MLNNQTSNLYRNGIPILELHQATNWLARLKGLFAYPPLSDSQGLLIRPCNAVHTFGMNYSIDVVFLARSGNILKLVQLESGSMAACRRAHVVVEMKQGTASRLDLQVGQTLLNKAVRSGDFLND